MNDSVAARVMLLLTKLSSLVPFSIHQSLSTYFVSSPTSSGLRHIFGGILRPHVLLPQLGVHLIMFCPAVILHIRLCY